MNAVEIEQAVSLLAEQPFDPAEFPFAFLQAFGNKDTTLKRLRKGESNRSDLPGAVLQTNNIHIAAAPPGAVTSTLAALRASPATARAKAKFILATDGDTLEAEDLASGDLVACPYAAFPDRFAFFLPLAGITTVKQLRESSFDIRATSRLNRLYVELLRDNPDWGTAARRPDMNHFMARLIFCFFAEDTDIFNGDGLFTATIGQMSARDSSDTHTVMAELFRAMNTPIAARAASGLRPWADAFPYVNGGLFSGSPAAPRFSRIARSYLLHIGGLDWTRINPDIFGSMIQAVTDDEERGALGMHYTSVPNILKVLNPLFLDGLRDKLAEAGDNARKLLNLRTRLSRIRVFDPACGSGNFLVIAYKEMRAIEAAINARRGEPDRRTDIPLTNFRGIEIRHFPAEVARLALIIAEYQCDVLYRGQKEALAEFLPLDAENWITCGNALRLDWLNICPPTGTGVKQHGNDLFQTPLDQTQIDFENQGGETYICGNPPYLGTKYQVFEQKEDLTAVFGGSGLKFGNLDYVGGWFKLGCEYISRSNFCGLAFVSTSSLFQGEQAELIYNIICQYDLSINWCHTEFKWANQASSNAGVTCFIIGLSKIPEFNRRIYDGESVRLASNIGPYLVSMPNLVVTRRDKPLDNMSRMIYGSMSNDNNLFTFSYSKYRESVQSNPKNREIFKLAIGGTEFINGLIRFSIYIEPTSLDLTKSQQDEFSSTFQGVERYRLCSKRIATKALARFPMYFAERRHKHNRKIFLPQLFSEKRHYITAGYLEEEVVVIAPHMQIVNGSMFDLALIISRIHLVWIATVCGKLETRYRYSNSLGWNTFPVPVLTDANKADLTHCAEDILLTREAHFPTTIADLYDPDTMPDDLRAAHDRNDETLERIYIGRRFRNDTERLEKLFELYTKMTAGQGAPRKRKAEARA